MQRKLTNFKFANEKPELLKEERKKVVATFAIKISKTRISTSFHKTNVLSSQNHFILLRQ